MRRGWVGIAGTIVVALALLRCGGRIAPGDRDAPSPGGDDDAGAPRGGGGAGDDAGPPRGSGGTPDGGGVGGGGGLVDASPDPFAGGAVLWSYECDGDPTAATSCPIVPGIVSPATFSPSPVVGLFWVDCTYTLCPAAPDGIDLSACTDCFCEATDAGPKALCSHSR